MRLRRLVREVVPFIEIFITSLIILVVIAINRGISHKEKLKSMEYPPRYTAMAISFNELQRDRWMIQEAEREVLDIYNNNGGVFTYFLDYYKEMSFSISMKPASELDLKTDKLLEDMKDVQVIGTISNYFNSFQPKLKAGRYFTKEEEGVNVCLIGENLANRLFGSAEESIGKTIEMSELIYSNPETTNMKIVGVFMGGEKLPARTIDMFDKPYQTVNVYSNDIVLLPLNTTHWSSLQVSNTIWLERDINEVKNLAQELTKIHPDYKFNINPEFTSFFKSSEAEKVSLYVLNAFVILTFVVAGMGVIGIQMISIGRRREEIGLNMAFGAKRRNVALMVLKESMGRFIAPSIAGILAGVYSLKRVSELMSIPILMDLNTMLIFALAVILFSISVGLYPALRAAAMDPVKAMGRAQGLS